MGDHAILSPSSSERWLRCTPSARLEEPYRDDEPGEAAKEGTLAHAIADNEIKYKLGTTSKLDWHILKLQCEVNPLWKPVMSKHVNDYVTYVFEQYNEAVARTPDAQLITEEETNFSAFVPDGKGTVDVKIIADNTLRIIDLKYGQGVPVSAVENTQLMLYALGSYLEYKFLYGIESIQLTIFQPRLDSVTNYTLTVDKLLDWAESTVKPRAKLAFKGEGDFLAGSHCRFCKVKDCRANKDYNIEIGKGDFKEAHLLTDKEISEILSRADSFKKWVKGVEDYALHQAVNKGKKYPGYKVVNGGSNRKYSSEEKVAMSLFSVGYTEKDIFKPKTLLGLGDLEGKTGTDDFKKYVVPFLIKPQGQPTLVLLSDDRPEYSSKAAAAVDFANVDISEYLTKEDVSDLF